MAHYSDGSTARIGDDVDLGDGDSGVIVALIEEGAYLPNFAKEDWDYLTSGVLIETRAAGLVHYPNIDSAWSKKA